MKGVSHELLMRYYDGELDADEAREVERLLDSDAEAAAVLSGLDQLGDMLRTLSDRRASAADEIADSVLARIDAGESRQEAPPASGPRPASRWSFPAVASALAVAAVAVLFIAQQREPQPTPVALTTPTAVPVPQPTLTAEPDDVEPPLQPAEEEPVAAAIESVDFGTHNGAIFLVSAGAEATPVVWLTDDAGESAGTTESL